MNRRVVKREPDKTYTEHLNKLGVGLDGQVGTEQFNNIGRNYWARISMKF